MQKKNTVEKITAQSSQNNQSMFEPTLTIGDFEVITLLFAPLLERYSSLISKAEMGIVINAFANCVLEVYLNHAEEKGFLQEHIISLVMSNELLFNNWTEPMLNSLNCFFGRINFEPYPISALRQ